METVIVEHKPEAPLHVYSTRFSDADMWINEHASGTLRKNKRLGFSWRKQYLEERIAWEFGWWFRCLPRSRVRFGDALTEEDCKEVTEGGWHMERFLAKWPFKEDRFEVKSIEATLTDDSIEKGIGLVVRETSAPWVPTGHIVYAIVIPEYDKGYRTARPL